VEALLSLKRLLPRQRNPELSVQKVSILCTFGFTKLIPIKLSLEKGRNSYFCALVLPDLPSAMEFYFIIQSFY
jgi:hypothetical protein